MKDTSKARKAAAAARAAKTGAGAGSAPSPRVRAARGGTAKGLPLLLLTVAVIIGVWLMFASATPALDSRLAGLQPWNGGPGWRVRPGQYIDPAAAKSLLGVGLALQQCTTDPMTLDVSREGGGLYPPHKSHQKGRDIDIRMTDLSKECRVELQKQLAAWGWTQWYDGPDAVSPKDGGVHKSHLHARFVG
jgi:hypothetical protein